MRRLKRSKDAIVSALKALRAHGFLDWLRRYVPTGNEGRGPQVQQTSNAYRMFLPPTAKRLLGRLFGAPPAPDDFSHCARAAQGRDGGAQGQPVDGGTALFAVEDEGRPRPARLGAALKHEKNVSPPSGLNPHAHRFYITESA
jgi:hypothetical protein